MSGVIHLTHGAYYSDLVPDRFNADLWLYVVQCERSLRQRRGWTQVYLAQHTGLGSVYISQLEHGKKEPGLRTIEILAVSFDMTPAQLLTGISET